MQQNFPQNYRDVPRNQLGTRLNLLARLLNNKNSKFILNEINEIAQAFLPNYRRRISDDPVSEDEILEMEEILEEYEEHEIDEIIDETFEALYFDSKILKANAMEILLIYSEEPQSNFGNRINQLADILAVSRKLDLEKNENEKFLNLVKNELVEISKIVGNDY